MIIFKEILSIGNEKYTTEKVKIMVTLLMAMIFSLIVGCQTKYTPSQISEKFWFALQNNNQEQIKRYSLKDSVNDVELDPSLKITGMGFGKIIIDGENAEVETVIQYEKDGKTEELALQTYLQIENQVWRVDYQMTVAPLLAQKNMDELMGDLKNLGDELAGEVEGAVEEFKEKTMPEIESQIEQAEEEIKEKLPEFKKMLEDILEDLQKSIEDSFPAPDQEPQAEPETQQT